MRELLRVLNSTREHLGMEHWGAGKLRAMTDATACQAHLQRRGCGSWKHAHLRDMWGQEAARENGIRVIKIPRDQNPADMLCSADTPAIARGMLKIMSASTMTKRPELLLHLSC